MTAEQRAAAVEQAKCRMAQAGRQCRNDDPMGNRWLRALIYNELCRDTQAAQVQGGLRLATADSEAASDAEPCKAAV